MVNAPTIDMHEIADRVAARMGEGWVGEAGRMADQVDAYVALAGTTGMRFRLRIAGSGKSLRDKAKITGRLPDNLLRYLPSQFEDEYGQGITVSAVKDPARIATDIQRRLMDRYVTMLAAAQAAKAEAQQDHDDRNALVTEMVAALGDLAVVDGEEAEWVRTIHVRGAGSYSREGITLTPGRSYVHAKLHIHVSLVARFAAMLGEL